MRNLSIKNLIIQLVSVLALLSVVGCASQPQSSSPTPTRADRPEWTDSKPDDDDGNKYFVGLSAVFTTEQSARDNALENATDRVVKYLGTFAKGKSLRMAKNFGLKSEKIDETLGGRAFQEQIYGSVARQVEAKKTHCDENVWKCFVLARVPTTVLDDALKNAHESAEKDARKRSKDANTSAAKEQALNEAEFHAQMKKDGFLD
jgi:hypothetical protein